MLGIKHRDATLPNDIDTAHRQIREQTETLRQQALRIAKHRLEKKVSSSNQGSLFHARRCVTGWQRVRFC